MLVLYGVVSSRVEVSNRITSEPKFRVEEFFGDIVREANQEKSSNQAVTYVLAGKTFGLPS
jgi:hypothetical protein